MLEFVGHSLCDHNSGNSQKLMPHKTKIKEIISFVYLFSVPSVLKRKLAAPHHQLDGFVNPFELFG